MKHQISTALHEYWLAAHTDKNVRAAGIDAAELAPLLPDLFLVDLDPTRNAVFRFCGAAIASRYGRDLTGESFLSLWGPLDRRTLERDFPLMAARGTGMVAGVVGETMGAGVISYEMLLLPLIGQHGGSGAIGSMGRIGGHDERNRIRGRILAQSFRSVRFLPAASPYTRPNVAAIHSLRQDTFPERRRYGHLTVVNGGK